MEAAQEIAAVAVGPVHHGGDGYFPVNFQLVTHTHQSKHLTAFLGHFLDFIKSCARTRRCPGGKHAHRLDKLPNPH